jgi:hypothetical protein
VDLSRRGESHPPLQRDRAVKALDGSQVAPSRWLFSGTVTQDGLGGLIGPTMLSKRTGACHARWKITWVQPTARHSRPTYQNVSLEGKFSFVCAMRLYIVTRSTG